MKNRRKFSKCLEVAVRHTGMGSGSLPLAVVFRLVTQCSSRWMMSLKTAVNETMGGAVAIFLEMA